VTVTGKFGPVASLRYIRRLRAIDRLVTTPGTDSTPGRGVVDYYRRPVRFDSHLHWSDARYLVLDVETTHVDPNRGHLLSLGWVTVDGGAVDAGSARHHFVRPPRGVDVGSSAAVHQITDTEVVGGDDVGDVVDELLADLSGRVLVCHFARLEIGFLNRVCRTRFGIGFWPWQLVDTMQWHADRRRRSHLPLGGDAVRLNKLMADYGLPPTRPHDALSDAFGTALLLLAMATVGLGRSPGRLRDLLDDRSWP
jgi:DNA polymerase-3 subunit epsilon